MHRSGNIFGGYRVIKSEGQDFLLFSGKASMRKYLNSRMFAANDPRLVKLGVGRMAANAALKSGVILSPAIRSFEGFFGDNQKSIESVLQVLVSVRTQWEASARRNRAEWARTKRDISYYLFTAEGQIEFMRRFNGGYGGYY